VVRTRRPGVGIVAALVAVLWLAAVPAAAPGAAAPAPPPPSGPAVPPAPGATSPDAAVPEQAPLDATSVEARIDALVARRDRGEEVAAAADRLFREVDAILWSTHRESRTAIARGTPDLLAQHARLIELYEQRDRLFDLISPALHERLVGGGAAGRTELRRELAYLYTRLLAQIRVVEQGARHIVANVGEWPLATFWGLIQLVLVLLVFRAWRRWSARGPKAWRQRLLAMRPRQASNLRLARALWYLDRIGAPLSWLVLILVLERLVSPRGFEELASLVYTVLVWIFVARLVVQLIDALAARGVGGLRAARAALRLRSLRWVAGWLVVLGLGSSLVTTYAGHGAIHAWTTRLGVLLSIVVVAVLIGWWREEVADRLEALSTELAGARRLAGRQHGLWGYPFTVLGAVYLLWVDGVDRIVRRLSQWELGRRVLAVLVRREVERDVLRSNDEDEEALPDALVERLLAAGELRLDSVAKAERNAVVASLRAGVGGGYVVLGERGMGKSVFLERVAEEIGEEMFVVGCPPDGHPGLLAAIATAFGLEGEAAQPEAVAEAIDASGIRVIAIDDAHRLARPWMGGQAGLDRLAELDGRITRPLSWVLAIDDRAWRYIALARGERALFQQVVPLPAWSEESLGFLLQGRAKACGLDLDYRRIVLPRQLDAGEHDSLEERNRFGYARILWELADGNAEVALRIFVRSLRRTRDGAIVVRLPQPLYSTALNEASIEVLLALRVIVQCEIARVEDLVRSLRIGEARARAILRFCLQNDWLEVMDGGYRLAWSWFRPITRTLVRRNLMAR
jgi:hypothetical protein